MVVPHLCADTRRAEILRHFSEEKGVSAVILFGDVTGRVLTDGEEVLYRQVQELFHDAPSIVERVKIARAYLAQPGVTEGYREAIRFYLSEIADLEMDTHVIWKGLYFRAKERLHRMVKAFGTRRRCLALADTLVCEEAFEGNLLDYRALAVSERLIKGVGLSPEDRIAIPAKYVPLEYRGALAHTIPLAEYTREFDIFVANSFSTPLQAALRNLSGCLAILPGGATEVTSFKGMTLAFESPGTFSLYKFQPELATRQVYRFVGRDLRLFRIDTFDQDFNRKGSEMGLDRPLRHFHHRPARAV